MNRQQAQELLDEFRTPHHVRAHCLQVARVGEFLAKKLNEAGIDVDPETVWIAGMIHDVVRVVDFNKLPEDLGNQEDRVTWKALRKTYKNQHHADVAEKILNEIGEQELADIVKRHKFISIGTSEGPQTWESKLLYYADKRVAHDQIVGLKERLDEGWARNFKDKPRIAEDESREAAIMALEEEIFEKLQIAPEDIKSLLGKTV